MHPTSYGCAPSPSIMHAEPSSAPNMHPAPTTRRTTLSDTPRPQSHPKPMHRRRPAPTMSPGSQTVPHGPPGPLGTCLALSTCPPTQFHVARPRSTRPTCPQPGPPIHQHFPAPQPGPHIHQTPSPLSMVLPAPPGCAPPCLTFPGHILRAPATFDVSRPPWMHPSHFQCTASPI